MKKYNKSAIMKLAHSIRRNEGLTMSVALKLAWDKARRSEFYWIISPRKRRNVKVDRTSIAYQNMMINYYANNTYNMD